MRNLVLNVVFPIVGAVLVAVFGPASIGSSADVFSRVTELHKLDHMRFVWAACGFLVFLIGEVAYLLCSRTSGNSIAILLGRLTQIAGCLIASWASLSAMVWFRRLGSPFEQVTAQDMATDLGRCESVLIVGLWIVAVGQIVIGIGRLKRLQESERVLLKNRSEAFRLVSTLSLILSLLILFAIQALFAFTSVFEFVLHGLFKEPLELSSLANELQGMILYPSLAYLLFIFYCLVEGIYFLIAKLTSSQADDVTQAELA